MSAQQAYRQWLDSPHVDEATKAELNAVAGDAAEIEERFHQHLQFGTAGLRGVLGAGTNRINTYTIRRVTQGLANHIADLGEEAKRRGVAIAYDCRRLSPELAMEAACTLAANGIDVHLFEGMRPSPELSFAVRELGAVAGVVLTASHNPPEYNGYKVYWEDGGQIVSERARLISQAVKEVRDFTDVRTCTPEEAVTSGHLHRIGEEIDARYTERLLGLLDSSSTRENSNNINIVYTPLHGAAGALMKRVLTASGLCDLFVVSEQEHPDGNFPTVQLPNPEEPEAFTLAVRCAQQRGADLILGTDPDGDRLGVLVPNASGDYIPLSGNQLGALLLHHLLTEAKKRRGLPPDAVMIKTIVTSEMGRAIAADFGVETVETLTGFKYIAELIERYEHTKEHTFLFGYEESLGYLAGTFVRDKDGLMIALLVCELAALCKQRGITLYGRLQDLYAQYGHYRETLVSRTMSGLEGLARIRSIMETWREQPPTAINGIAVTDRRDYLSGICTKPQTNAEERLTLPQENVLHYTLEDGSWFCLRPSGTEPKMKIYLAVRANSEAEAEARLQELQRDVLARLDRNQTPVG